uniref:Putative secreted protein n=1 Tax=Ixodes ricinus TaxID=34613 RepID=A0A6B0U5U6_IXORI
MSWRRRLVLCSQFKVVPYAACVGFPCGRRCTLHLSKSNGNTVVRGHDSGVTISIDKRRGTKRQLAYCRRRPTLSQRHSPFSIFRAVGPPQLLTP